MIKVGLHQANRSNFGAFLTLARGVSNEIYKIQAMKCTVAYTCR